ncbi:MAG: EAL domain-containing protein [Pseudobutyrivibrio sp.]|nr:EAL domain-containing protein [Pseudobutyrivibrio sp.]
MAFFVLFMARAYLFYFYTECLTTLDHVVTDKQRVMLLTPFAIFEFFTISSLWNGWVFYIDETGYHSGPYKNLILYTGLFFYIFLSIAIVIMKKSVFPRKRMFLQALAFNVVLLMGGVIRYLFPSYLLMDTFCVMASLIIYLSMSNPEFLLDSKTGLFNQKALATYVSEVEDPNRLKYLGFTIHNYNEIVEMYGTEQMDRGLKQIGIYLKNSFKNAYCFYCRWGRFMIVGEFDDEIVREQLHNHFILPIREKDMELFLNISVCGISAQVKSPSAQWRVSEILHKLDALSVSYASEDYLLTNDNFTEYSQDVAIRKNIEYALDNDLIEIYLQPLVDAHTGRVVAAEALARIFNENGQMVSPGDFIPVAERNGRINDIGEVVLSKTCDFIRANDMESLGLRWINVNVSPTQMQKTDLGDIFDNCLAAKGVDPSMVHIEITEEAMVDTGLLKRQLTSMIDRGYQFALDDYGKGYSNIVRLKRCPFVNIKLDLELVWDYCKEPDEILPNMVSGFRNMGFTVTAEGVENQEYVQAMRDIGVDYLQGYFYSKPLPTAQFVKRVIELNKLADGRVRELKRVTNIS